MNAWRKPNREAKQPMQNYEPVLCPGIMFAEKVIREHGTGKISLINMFNAFFAPSFPFQTPGFFICLWLTNLSGKISAVDITIRIEEPTSGHVLTSACNHIEIKPDAPPIPKNAILELIFPCNPFTVRSPGQYCAVVLVNNERLGSRFFEVGTPTKLTQENKP